jgi:anti-anti-sigma regulatory factor
MFRIEKFSNGNIVFTLSGHFEAEHLSELQQVLSNESAATGIVLDLRELVLVDNAVAEFLARCEADGMTLENCPAYVRRWIDQVKGKTK